MESMGRTYSKVTEEMENMKIDGGDSSPTVRSTSTYSEITEEMESMKIDDGGDRSPTVKSMNNCEIGRTETSTTVRMMSNHESGSMGDDDKVMTAGNHGMPEYVGSSVSMWINENEETINLEEGMCDCIDDEELKRMENWENYWDTEEGQDPRFWRGMVGVGG